MLIFPLQEDNTEVEFSAEEIQKLYAMSKPATPVQPKANNTSTPREKIKIGMLIFIFKIRNLFYDH